MSVCFHTLLHTSVHTPDSYNVKRAFEPLDTITNTRWPSSISKICYSTKQCRWKIKQMEAMNCWFSTWWIFAKSPQIQFKLWSSVHTVDESLSSNETLTSKHSVKCTIEFYKSSNRYRRKDVVGQSNNNKWRITLPDT